jgi:hypothetical protein
MRYAATEPYQQPVARAANNNKARNAPMAKLQGEVSDREVCDGMGGGTVSARSESEIAIRAG